MNIVRCVDNYEGEGTLIDLEYEYDKKSKKFKVVDLRIHAIINNIVGEVMGSVSVVDKIVIAKEIVYWLEQEKTDNEE